MGHALVCGAGELSQLFRDMQAALAKDGVAMLGPNTDTLTGGNRHFSATGLEAHGKMWAEKVAAYLDSVPGQTTCCSVSQPPIPLQIGARHADNRWRG